MTSPEAPVVVLSAGAEVITVSLVEELLAVGLPVALASFGQRSLFSASKDVCAYERIEWPDVPEQAAARLVAFTRPMAAASGRRLVAFATDDAVLRLLFEQRRLLEETLCVPRAAALSYGGLDKAELVEFLQQRGLGEFVPPTVVLGAPSDLPRALRELGPEIVVKPALKPYRSELALDHVGRKLLASWEYPSVSDFSSALEQLWGFSEARWIAQPRLHAPPGGETVVWVVRAATGEMRSLSATAKWKYPPVGGTGCHVETAFLPEAESIGRRLADVVELQGLAEFEFLEDSAGRLRLLDCNARPWLQVGLARAAGLPVAVCTWHTLSGKPGFPLPDVKRAPVRSWIMIERMLLGALSCSGAARLSALGRALRLARTADYVAIYGTALGGVRRAWGLRMVSALLRRARRIDA